MKKYNYIYKITNRVNGKIYIGKHSTNRLNDGYMGSGAIIRQAIKKYGVHNFSKFILCLCHDEESLNRAEINYISDYGSTDRSIGYNLTYGGDGGIPTDEVRKKIGEGMKGNKNCVGRILSEDTRNKLAEAGKRRHHTEETRNKLSESLKGHKCTDDTKQKMSVAKKGVLKPKYKWLTPDGNVVEMDKPNVTRYHKDWIQIQENKQLI